MQLLVGKSHIKTKMTPQYQQGIVDYIKPSLKARPLSQHNMYGRVKHKNINISLNDLNKTTSVFVTPQLDASQMPQRQLANSLIFSTQQKKSQNENQRKKTSSLRFTGSSFIETDNIENRLFNSINLSTANNLEQKPEQNKEPLPSASKDQLQQMYNDETQMRTLAQELVEQQADNLPSYPRQWLIQETQNLIQDNIREIQPKTDSGKKYHLQFCRQSVSEHAVNYKKANKFCGKSLLLQNQYQINKERFKIKYGID